MISSTEVPILLGSPYVTPRRPGGRAGTISSVVPGRWLGGGQHLLSGDGRSGWRVAPSLPSPAWQIAPGVSGDATGAGQSARVSWAVQGPGIARDCTCNQGISHSKLWSFRLLYSELNFGSKHGGYSETQ